MKDKILKIIGFLRTPFDYVCHEENDTGIAKIGYLFSWLASGTDCRCCIGMRVFVALIVGLVVGICL